MSYLISSGAVDGGGWMMDVYSAFETGKRVSTGTCGRRAVVIPGSIQTWELFRPQIQLLRVTVLGDPRLPHTTVMFISQKSTLHSTIVFSVALSVKKTILDQLTSKTY
jgi:hypothetical protein